MDIKDTSKHANQVVVGIYRKMSSSTKGDLIFDAYRTGRELAIAGLHSRYPKADYKKLWYLWARGHLGDELFQRVYGGTLNE